MDRATQGWVAGAIGCIVKSAVNAFSNRLGIMGMRNSTVGTDMVLGKTIMKRSGIMPWLVGEIASSQLGGIWGTLMGLIPSPKGKNVWIVRGIQFGSLAWMIDMAIGARSIPRAVQGDVSPKDAFLWWTQHQIFGLVTSYLLDANPSILGNSIERIGRRRIDEPVVASTTNANDHLDSLWSTKEPDRNVVTNYDLW